MTTSTLPTIEERARADVLARYRETRPLCTSRVAALRIVREAYAVTIAHAFARGARPSSLTVRCFNTVDAIIERWHHRVTAQLVSAGAL